MLALLLATQLGCSSSGAGSGTRATPPPTPAVSAERVTSPARIQRLEAQDRNGGVDIDVVADRALVWTTYRDAEGNLVVELPNSEPDPSLGTLSRNAGLIRSVDIEKLVDAERPLTRLVIRTREDTEHSLTTEGETLRLQLLPVGYEAPVALAYEPLPETTEPPEDLEPAYADAPSDAPSMAAAGAAVDFGTPEAPRRGPPAIGVLASRLTGIEVLRGDDATVIQVAGDGEFEYATFRLTNPERFVLDLDGVINTSLRSTVPVGDVIVDQVRVGQFKPRPDPVSRVVFDLSQLAVPNIVRDGDGLTITFGTPSAVPPPTATLAETVADDELPEVPAAPQPAAPQPAAPQPAAPQPAAPQPAAPLPAAPEVVIAEELPAEPAMPEPEPAAPEPAAPEPAAPEPAAPEPAAPLPAMPEPEHAPEVVVAEVVPPPPPEPTPPTPEPTVPLYQPPAPEAVAQAPAPEPTPPPLMASSETPATTAGSVTSVEAQQMEIEAAGETTQIIPPRFESLVVSSQQRSYVGEPITMSLRNADLVETLRSFSRISDLDFVIQPGVQGTVTVELHGVPWDQALEQILKINSLGMDIDGTIVRIAPLQQLQQEAEARRRLAEERKRTVPLTTVMHSLSYANARDVATLLESRNASRDRARSTILSTRGSVQVDRRTNTLIIRELPEVIDTVLAVVRNLDTAEPQVRIEARIVEATKRFSRSLGVQWGFTGEASQRLGNTTGLEFPNNIQTNGGVNLLTGGNNAFLNLSLGNILDSFTLDASLLAAENEGLINVVSSPSVLILNNEQAVIQSGIQIPVQTVANNTVTVQFINATLQLAVQPQITAEGTILMQINVAKKEPQPSLLVQGAQNAPIATREASTRVIVRDGGTAVIGGIYEVSNNQSQDRVPGLANVPILGHLFKNRSRENTNQELLIFVTPRIVQL